MKGQKLDTQQVFAGSNAAGHGEVVPTVICDHRVDGPFSVGETVVGDFEPLKTRRASVDGAVYFCEPVAYGT